MAQTPTTPTVKPVVLKTPTEYYIQNASPNGKWACGVFLDFGNSTFAFRWNLESNEIELLDPANQSYAYDVSDDGIVVGTYTDTEYYSNGAPVTLAGYWQNGKWNRLEMPEGTLTAGASSISADGHYICGNVQLGELLYDGYVWKDGKIDRQLRGTTINMPYDISPDGQMVTGWFQRDNRTAALWLPNDEVKVLSNLESPFSHGSKFSPDGKKLLFWGGWANFGTDEKPQWGLPSIYDIATGDMSPTLAADSLSNFDVCDISNDGTVVGQNGLAYVWQDGKAWDANDYLTAKGVDLDDENVFWYPETEKYQVYYGLSVSADANVMGFRYYDDATSEGDTTVLSKSMVVKFNQPTTGLIPTSVKAQQVAGLTSVLVQWKPNVSAQGIKGYNVYRDGNKLNSELLTEEGYVDAAATLGNHTYTVTAMYGDKESEKSLAANVTVAAGEVSAPLSLYAQQHGYNAAYLGWDSPESNFGKLSYFDKTTDKVDGFGVNEDALTYENAIRFNGYNTAAYKGKQISAVSFYPMSEQKSWAINVYTLDDKNELKKLYSQPITQQLVYGEKNTVKLTTPVAMPEGELIVAIQVEVTTPSMNITGMCYGKSTEEYSDLLREVGEDDMFYSIGAATKAQGYIYPVSWAMDAVITDANADLNADDVDFYEVYVDGKNVGWTSDKEYTANGLANGAHTVGVKAVYANGVKSALKEASVNIAADNSRLVGVSNVGIEHKSDTQVKAYWSAPKDADKTILQYCGNTASNGAVQNPESSVMVSSLYPSSMFKGRSNYNITSARFYPIGDATYTVLVYEDDQVISETEVENVALNKWNEVQLSEPVAVKEGCTYRLAIDCFDIPCPDGTHFYCPIATDTQPGVSGYSNLYSLTGGESWNPLSSSALNTSWMLGIGIEASNPLPLPVAGYDISIDGKKQNTEMLTANTYDYTFAAEDANRHTVQVDVYYTVEPTKSVKGDVNTFYIGTAGIADNTIASISLRKGDNEITVEGNNVTSVSLVAANGATVAEAAGNTVSLSGVAAGVYVVKAVVDGETVVRKVQVK